MRTPVVVVLILVAFAIGCFSAVVFHQFQEHRGSTGFGKQVREGGGVFTNPLLECDVALGVIDAPRARFERELKKSVSIMLEDKRATEIAVYYRDLNDGPAFGINQDKEFFPASLLKTPLMMAFLKHAESDPSLLTKTVTYTKANAPEIAKQTIEPDVELIDGQQYSIDQLLENMIRYSDNHALSALYPLLPEKEYRDLFSRLGVDDINLEDAKTRLTVVEYSTFFRVLYNASYLNQDMSEKALGLLTKTAFVSGLRSGVPESIPIAHKFGERDLGDGYYQLHDCGIVYVPKSPYLICVMTRGTNQKALESVIQDISSFAYKEVTSL